MRTPSRLGGFGLVLAVVGGLGLVAGRVIGPEPGAAPAQARPELAANSDADAPPGQQDALGLTIASGGYRLQPEGTELEPGVAREVRFRILGPDGAPLERYDARHERELHLIVVSRDLAWFEHLHPQRDADGTWRQLVTVPAAGMYRAYADFAPADAEPLTLGFDVSATGEYQPHEPTAASTLDEVDGYAVSLTGELTAGQESELGFHIERDGTEVVDLDPYLGAYGHLVAIRAGDLAYLHVHPSGAPADGSTSPGPEVRFAAHVPSAGTYRLFLDFSHADVVRTAAFTVEVADQNAAPVEDHSPGSSDDHH